MWRHVIRVCTIDYRNNVYYIISFKSLCKNYTMKSVTTHYQFFMLTWHAMAAPVFHPMRITGLPGKSVFSSLILALVAAIIWSRQAVMVKWLVAVAAGMTTIITWPSVDRCANHCCARVVCIEPLFGLDGAITRMGWLGNLRWKQGPYTSCRHSANNSAALTNSLN